MLVRIGLKFMNLCLTNLRKNISLLKPVKSQNRDVNCLIAQIKFFISESTDKNIILDLTEINYLDCIKISSIVGTYHFLDLDNKKIFIIVGNKEVQDSIKTLSFDNIEIIHSSNKFALEGIA